MVTPVSYTHLDVYKRQQLQIIFQKLSHYFGICIFILAFHMYCYLISLFYCKIHNTEHPLRITTVCSFKNSDIAPMDGVRFTKPVRAVDDIKFLTCDDQQRFLEVAQRSHNYNQYALILETSLRFSYDAIAESSEEVSLRAC